LFSAVAVNWLSGALRSLRPRLDGVMSPRLVSIPVLNFAAVANATPR
jgi:hypothetical protein